MSQPNVFFLNFQSNGTLIDINVDCNSDYYIKYLDQVPVCGHVPDAVHRVYDYKLHQWFSIPNREQCTLLNEVLPYCSSFDSV